MNGKRKRRRKILNLIASRPIESQESLGRALSEVGIAATQSTLSKDIKELGIVKVPEGDGFRYRTARDGSPAPFREQMLRRELSDFVVDLDGARNVLVVKTLTGYAQGVCESIDRADWEEVVGTIAGENTIFILVRSDAGRETLRTKILDLMGER